VLLAARCKNGTQKTRQKSPSGHHRTTLSGYIFATTAHIDNRKKNLLSSDISSRCPHNMVNFGILAAEIISLVWGTPANFNGFRVLAALLHGTLVGRPLAHISNLYILCCGIFVFRMDVCFCYVRPLFSFFGTSQKSDWEERLQNYIFCVEWDVKSPLEIKSCL